MTGIPNLPTCFVCDDPALEATDASVVHLDGGGLITVCRGCEDYLTAEKCDNCRAPLAESGATIQFPEGGHAKVCTSCYRDVRNDGGHDAIRADGGVVRAQSAVSAWYTGPVVVELSGTGRRRVHAPDVEANTPQPPCAARERWGGHRNWKVKPLTAGLAAFRKACGCPKCSDYLHDLAEELEVSFDG